MESIEVCIELCHRDARLPEYARAGDAGMDIYAVEDCLIEAGVTKIVKTGLKVAVPTGFEIQIRPRSGVSLKTPLRLANSPGTIDVGYRDEIGIIVHNTSQTEDFQVNRGDRIAQMVLQRVPVIAWNVVGSVADIGWDRGGGFGSSGF